MFKSAALKLTLWYVGALFLVCLMFSVPTYTIASARLRRGAEHQTEVIRQLPGGFPGNGYISKLEAQREKQLNDDKWELFKAFMYFNILIIGAGSVASYWFARRTLEPIREAHQAQARFTADASHELRTPLANMQSEIDVALRDKQLTTKQAREILASNLEEISRLQVLSEQLLSLTRLEAKDAKFTLINFSKIVEQETTRLLSRHNFVPELKVHKKILVNGDEALLTQVISILTTNALTYAAGDDPRLTVELTQKNNRVTFVMSDHGSGISEEDLPRIFDRFYRGTNATTLGVAGHGLGLALVKQIVEAHQGTIDVSSKPKKGTTFTINLNPSASTT